VQIIAFGTKVREKENTGACLQVMRRQKKTRPEIILKAIDCVRGMRSLADDSIDLVVTSPPYNLGVKYRNYRDSRARDDYILWSQEWAREVRRILKDSGSFFLNLGACPSNPLVPHELIVELKKMFVLQNTFHWIKSITIQTRDERQISAGHFKPLHSERYVNDCHEYVFHLTKRGITKLDRLGIGVPYSDKSNIARWAHTNGRDLRCRGNNWFIPYQTIVSRSKQRPHPATFPVELAVNCIKIHGGIADCVMLDPFVGIGHSAIAAQRSKIAKFIGFDIDREYIKVARIALTKGVMQTTEAMREPRFGRNARAREEGLLF
jgi:site-specific DNA-methyltransferase (adenine-specific)